MVKSKPDPHWSATCMLLIIAQKECSIINAHFINWHQKLNFVIRFINSRYKIILKLEKKIKHQISIKEYIWRPISFNAYVCLKIKFDLIDISNIDFNTIQF